MATNLTTAKEKGKKPACPHCRSLLVRKLELCPECGEQEIRHGPLVEHSGSGKIGAEVRVEYKRKEERYECNACRDVFDQPKTEILCGNCAKHFDDSDLIYLDLNDSESVVQEILQTTKLTLVLTPPSLTNTFEWTLLKAMTDKKMKGILVSFTRPYDSLQTEFEQRGIKAKNVFVIDTLSGSDSDPVDNCLYVKSPSSLNDITIFLDTAAEKLGEGRFVILDSLASLVMFNQLEESVRFVGFMSAKTRKRKLAGVLMTLSTEERRLAEQVGLFCDQVIRLEE